MLLFKWLTPIKRVTFVSDWSLGKKFSPTFDTIFHVYLMSGLKKYAKIFSDLSGLSICISKWIKWIFKKATEKFFLHVFSIHSSSRHKNVVECYKDFFDYFNPLETYSVFRYYQSTQNHQRSQEIGNAPVIE